MIAQANGTQNAAWALKGQDGTLLLSDVCSSQRQALELRKQQMLHQPQRGALGVVPVIVTVQECKP